MTQVIKQDLKRKQQWINRLRALTDQIANWSDAQGWHVERSEKTIEEESLGEYEAPSLSIRIGSGELLVTPVALDVMGGGGRVDLRAIPTLSRVKLVGLPAGDWRIITDSNVPIRLPWESSTFVQLANDLLS